MDVILIAGLWLDATVWAETADQLRALGHRPIPVDLPGAGDHAAATLPDQVNAVVSAIDSADRAVVVGHSAAATLAWIGADRRPQQVARTVLLGGFPTGDGTPYAAFFPIVEGLMPFPGWEAFDGADSADLDDAAKGRIAAGAHPVPEGVATGIVHLRDERRFDVPVVLVCPEYSPDQARGWVAAGEVPEIAAAHDVTYLDIDSGHWPMVSAPGELARVLSLAATGG